MSETRDEMTLERAVEIINANGYGGCRRWWIDESWGPMGTFVRDHGEEQSLSRGQAIDVAWRLEREAAAPAAIPSRDDLELEVRACVALIANKIRVEREAGRSDVFSGCAINMHGATGMRFLAMADRLANPPAPAAPPRGAAEGDGDEVNGTVKRLISSLRGESVRVAATLAVALGYDPRADDCPSGAELAEEAADKIRDLQSRLDAAEARPELNVTIGERDGATTIEVPDGVPADVADELAGASAKLMGGRVVGVTRDAEARPQVGEATRVILNALFGMVESSGDRLWINHDEGVGENIEAEAIIAALRECGIEVPR